MMLWTGHLTELQQRYPEDAFDLVLIGCCFRAVPMRQPAADSRSSHRARRLWFMEAEQPYPDHGLGARVWSDAAPVGPGAAPCQGCLSPARHRGDADDFPFRAAALRLRLDACHGADASPGRRVD